MSEEFLNLVSEHPTAASSLAAATAGLAILYALYQHLLPKPLPGIPYNKDAAKHLLGDVPDMLAVKSSGGRQGQWWAEQTKKHNSPIIQFFLPFSQPSIAIADYRESRDLLLRRGKELIRGKLNTDTWTGLIPNHFIAMEDSHPRYKGTRSLVKDLMAPTFLHTVSAPSSYEMVLNLIELWKLKIEVAGDYSFDAGDDLNHLTFDIMAASALGVDPKESATVKHIRKLQAAGLPKASGPAPVKFPAWDTPELLSAIFVIEDAAGKAISSPNATLFHWYNKLFNSEIRHAAKVKDATLLAAINDSSRRLAENPTTFKPRSAVDYMVQRELQAAQKAGTKPSFASGEMSDGLIGYLIGGQDSTHSTLCFAAKRLSQYQDVQRKLREALHKAYPDAYENGRLPTADEITKTQVPYVDAFIQEVLRADPPSPAAAREAACDMQILGHFIPKGTVIVLPLDGPTIQTKGWDIAGELRSESSAKHQDLGDWAHSEYPGEEFRPERWLKTTEGGNEVYDSSGPFMSFSSGTRGCWGQRLAYLELRLITTLLVWNFRFDPIPAEMQDWDIYEEIFAKPTNTFVQIKVAEVI